MLQLLRDWVLGSVQVGHFCWGATRAAPASIAHHSMPVLLALCGELHPLIVYDQHGDLFGIRFFDM